MGYFINLNNGQQFKKGNFDVLFSFKQVVWREGVFFGENCSLFECFRLLLRCILLYFDDCVPTSCTLKKEVNCNGSSNFFVVVVFCKFDSARTFGATHH